MAIAARQLRALPVEPDVRHVRWQEFLRSFDWNPGEHVTIIGPTGQGKTTLALAILETRRYVAILATKRRDKVLSGLMRKGWIKVDRWPRWTRDDPNGDRHLIVWPPIGTKSDVADVTRAQKVLKEALDKIIREGGWTVYVDELLFASTWLDLQRQLEFYWQQARSEGVSLVVATQRSSRVPLLAYDQVSHIFAFRDNDRQNAERIGEMAGQNRLEVRDIVQNLGDHEFLYVDVRHDDLVVSKVERNR